MHKHRRDTNASLSSAAETLDGDLHTRLVEAAGDLSYRKLGTLTDTHPETVRRYMQGQAPSALFLAKLCLALGVSGQWLLTGRGPMLCEQMLASALGQANPSELMNALAQTMSSLTTNLEHLDHQVQRLSSKAASGETQGGGSAHNANRAAKLSRTEQRTGENASTGAAQGHRAVESKPASASPTPASSSGATQETGRDPAKRISAQQIRDAIARRVA